MYTKRWNIIFNNLYCYQFQIFFISVIFLKMLTHEGVTVAKLSASCIGKWVKTGLTSSFPINILISWRPEMFGITPSSDQKFNTPTGKNLLRGLWNVFASEFPTRTIVFPSKIADTINFILCSSLFLISTTITPFGIRRRIRFLLDSYEMDEPDLCTSLMHSNIVLIHSSIQHFSLESL